MFDVFQKIWSEFQVHYENKKVNKDSLIDKHYTTLSSDFLLYGKELTL